MTLDGHNSNLETIITSYYVTHGCFEKIRICGWGDLECDYLRADCLMSLRTLHLLRLPILAPPEEDVVSIE